MLDIMSRSMARNKLLMLKNQLCAEDWEDFIEIAKEILTDEQLAFLLDQVTDQKTAPLRSVSFSTLDELNALWIAKHKTLPDWLQTHAEACLRKANILHDSSAREVQVKRLSFMLNISWDNPPLCADMTSFKNTIAVTHYGMEDAIQQIEEELIAAKYARKRWMKPILLHGPYGVGKTSLIKAVAQYLHIPYVFSALGGKCDSAAFSGDSQIYANAEAGLFLSMLGIAGTTRAVIHIDEIDKVFESSNGQYQSKLANIFLEPFDTGWMTDDLLGFPVDIRDALIFVTANDLSTIPTALLDRMQVIYLKGYSASEKQRIAKEYVWPKLQSLYDITLPHMTDEAVDTIVGNRYLEPGVRGIEKDMENILRHALTCAEQGKPLACIDKETVLGRIPQKQKQQAAQKPIVGQIHSLGVTPDLIGVVTTIQGLAQTGKDRLKIIGNPTKDFEQNCELAFFLACKNTSASEKELWLHLGIGATRMSGPSAGLALYVAAFSALSDIPIRGDMAATGAIDLYGNVLPVDGVKSKIEAAMQSGCNCVLLPYENLLEIQNSTSIDLIGIRHIDEVETILRKYA